jgi:prepilin-type N-terminal cleavage/methylation domain-containing protein
MKQKGFTLIELLVVISIISLIASITLVAFNNARISARNSKRVQDAEVLYKAFNLGLSNGGSLPDSASGLGGWFCISSSCYGSYKNYTFDATTTAFLAPFLPQYPSDPTDNDSRLTSEGGYFYDSAFTATSTITGTTLTAQPVIWYSLESAHSQPTCGSGIPMYYLSSGAALACAILIN